MNNIKTVLLLGGLTGLFIFIGGLAGGQSGMIIALVLAGAMNFFAYWQSDKLVLSMYGAKPVSESQAPDVHRMVATLSQRAGIPKPRVYVIDDNSPNAFATGRNPENGVVALSTGLIKVMNRDELEGVIAHELSHIKHRDTLISTVAATIAGAIMVIASMMRIFAIFGFGGSDDDGGENVLVLLIMAIVAPIAAMIIQMAISRSREYKADRGAASLTRNPYGLASSLEKLGYYSGRIPMKSNGQTAHMFIVNPLSGKSFTNLFATHPPIEDRIQRLRTLKDY